MNKNRDIPGKVLVNCMMGMSRSSTCVLSYMMIKLNMTSIEALMAIRRHRECRPNDGFLRQVSSLEHSITWIWCCVEKNFPVSNFDITGIELVPFPVTFKLDWNFRHPDGKEVKEKRFSNAAGAGTLSFDSLKWER